MHVLYSAWKYEFWFRSSAIACLLVLCCCCYAFPFMLHASRIHSDGIHNTVKPITKSLAKNRRIFLFFLVRNHRISPLLYYSEHCRSVFLFLKYFWWLTVLSWSHGCALCNYFILIYEPLTIQFTFQLDHLARPSIADIVTMVDFLSGPMKFPYLAVPLYIHAYFHANGERKYCLLAYS